MPTLPAPLAATAERWLARPVTVVAADVLSPNLRRVTFSGGSLRNRSWRPGDEVQFRVSDRDLRHYTPSRFDPVAGTFDVVFCTLANGPGSGWAAGLRCGQQVRVIGPSPSIRLRAGRSVLLGDASTLGLFASISAAGADPAARGAIEVPLNDRQAAARLVPRLDILTTRNQPGAALHAWLADQAFVTAGPDREAVYLAGHAQTLQRLRTALRATGVPRDSIITKAYWATGRVGL